MSGQDNRLLAVLCLVLLGSCMCRDGPRWVTTLEDVLRAGISENSPVLTTKLGTLEAVSETVPPSKLIYAANSDIVRVNAETGNVFLNAVVDRERQAQHQITFFAFDNSGSANVTVTLVLLDYNDNSPQFLDAPYSFTVNENTETSTVVFSDILVTDADVGENAEISLFCSPRSSEDQLLAAACHTFDIQSYPSETVPGAYKGVVSLKRPLSFNVRDTYMLHILARDNGEPQLTSRQIITVLVQQANTQLQQPTFLNLPLRLVIYENRNEVSRQIQARSGNIESSIILQIKSDPESYFAIGETIRSGDQVFTAELLTRQMLDREALDDGTYSFTVEAIESMPGESDLRSEVSVSVEVIDVNDNAPSFDQDSYIMTVQEDETGENLLPDIMVLTDSDTGDNAYMAISLLGEGSEYFAVSPSVVTQRGDIQLKVVQAPDYDDGTHQIILTIVARETQTAQQRSTSATITINVEDVNDNDPLFLLSEYTAYLREDRPIGYNMINITATDLDSSFGPLQYSLSGDGSDMYRVSAQTGQVYLTKELDFESRNVYRLTYTATDSGDHATSVPLRIEVLDFNDQGPVFDRDEYRSSTNESSTQLLPNVTVKAADQETDEDVTYRIIEGNSGGVFMIGEKTGILVLLRPLSYEETDNGIVTLLVEASDNGLPPQMSTVPVIITVLDENNHSPVFGNATYTRTIVETSPDNTPVVQIRASDLDSGQNGRLRYILYSGAKDNFVVNRVSGLISVAEQADLDIDVFGKNYDILAYAVDQGSPQRTATAQVYITVLEANNKDPVFRQDFYTFTIMESVSVGSPVDTVAADDPDLGSEIRYSILPGSVTAKDRSGTSVRTTDPIDYRVLFRVDPQSGGIYTNGALDRDYVAEVSFVVQATDINAQTANKQVGTADVIITIRSTSDNELTFNGPWSSQNPIIEVFISEEEPGATPVTTVIATDPETGLQVRDYRKVAGSDPQSFFTLNRETGQIFLNKRMDYENPNTRQKSFRVEAFTQAPNVRSAMATVTVTTTDINDHQPKFMKSSYAFDASEDLNPLAQIGVVLATDDDSGDFGKITYSLSGQGSDVFNVHPELGYIEVAEDHQLDREWISSFVLIVRATDLGGKYTEVPLHITVLDENDSKPEFTSPEYNMYTLEYVGPLTSLGQVHAKDQDVGANGAITYRLTNGNEAINVNGMTLGDLFTVDTSAGVIRSRKDMVGYARDYPYSLIIEGQDGGTPSERSTTIVQIHVSDVDRYDGRPTIEFPPEDGLVITVPENTSPGVNITQIIASDSDLGPEGELEIGFVANDALDGDHSLFNIDSDTGLITIKENLDRELKETYELLVYVRDKGSPPNTVTRKIIIHVIDINDNSPSFNNNDGCPELELNNPMYASVLEEAPVNTYVTTVKACDPDSPPNDKMYYFIVRGNNIDNETKAFKINKESGEILTNYILDREIIPQFILTIYASSVPNPNITIIREAGRKKRAVDEDDAMLQLVINIDDVNDNGPIFPPRPGGDTLVIGLPSNLPYGSEIVTMQAADPDDAPDYTYSIAGITFTDDDQDTTAIDLSEFIIDGSTGVISTGRENYEKYRGGLFKVVVHATDSQRKRAATELIIYVLSASQRLKFKFTGTPQEVRSWYETFFSEMNNYLVPENTVIKADTLQHAIDFEGRAVYNGTDICFHMLQNNQVIGQRRARELLDELESKNRFVPLLYSQYNMLGLDVCEPHVTTQWWSGWWWLWWLLIALALFIILVSIIIILVICCCWPKYHRPVSYYDKPYVVLDPVSVVPPNYGFEWQEQVVKMN